MGLGQAVFSLALCRFENTPLKPLIFVGFVFSFFVTR
jgi:hypothetical protein